jgi:hypothetical protein
VLSLQYWTSTTASQPHSLSPIAPFSRTLELDLKLKIHSGWVHSVTSNGGRSGSTGMLLASLG